MAIQSVLLKKLSHLNKICIQMRHEPISVITNMLVNQEISGDAAVNLNFI